MNQQEKVVQNQATMDHLRRVRQAHQALQKAAYQAQVKLHLEPRLLKALMNHPQQLLRDLRPQNRLDLQDQKVLQDLHLLMRRVQVSLQERVLKIVHQQNLMMHYLK